MSILAFFCLTDVGKSLFLFRYCRSEPTHCSLEVKPKFFAFVTNGLFFSAELALLEREKTKK